VRGADARQTIELQVPDLGPEVGQIVLACDERGVLTWHLPVDSQQRIEASATRGAGGLKRFVIPAIPPPPPQPGAAPRRGVIGLVGRKVLKVLVYPMLDPVIGPISEMFAERWEERHRPYGLRMFSRGTFREPKADPLSAADVQLLRGGRALLFIHGTFSTAHGAFNLITDGAFKALCDRYQGRVFAFNHFTLSHDPRRNVEWLLAQLPAWPPLDVDIVCHSRGGLVARALTEQPSAFGLDTSRVVVRRIVFAGVPNGGTLLAHPDHMVTMIDRLTTALNLFPTGAITETLEAIITTVKVVGHGALNGLDGLASMRPGGSFLTRLNQGTPAGDGYYAIAADYEPTDQGLRSLIAGTLANGVLDRVFEDIGNDLVVPEPGVYGANGSGAFPIPEGRVLRVPANAGVLHTTLFGYEPACSKIAEWLA
jgi:pimeloyl-ACP methyl ester carboxylesterase